MRVAARWAPALADMELGLALTVQSVVGVAAQLPVGYLVDRVGSRRMHTRRH